jgi:hypothetical protein
MPDFKLPQDLMFNRDTIQDPASYARETGCVSWLSLTGPEYAAMEDGISYKQIRAAVPKSANVISDPPRVLNLSLARKMIAALDELPRPTLISCRVGPRASAAAYLYAGLKQQAEVEEILAAAKRDGAPFYPFSEYRVWVRRSLQSLRRELLF